MVLRVIREKDTYLKMHARLELTVNNIKMSTPTLQKQAEDLRRQLESVKSDERFYKKQINKLREDIDQNTYDFLKQDKVEKSEAEALREQIAINRKLSLELEEASNKCAQFGREIEQIKVEKELKARELIRGKNKLRASKNDLAIEELAIQDAAKRCTETQNRLKDFQALYEQVKNERNKYVLMLT